MTCGSIIFAQSSCEEDGLHLNSGLPEFSIPKSAASRINPTYVVKPGNDGEDCGATLCIYSTGICRSSRPRSSRKSGLIDPTCAIRLSASLHELYAQPRVGSPYDATVMAHAINKKTEAGRHAEGR
jgi:hypothetical protein